MPKVRSVKKLSITKAVTMLNKLDRIMLPGEVVCIERTELSSYRDKKKKSEKVPIFALVPWELFEQMLEVTNTIEDKLQMMEFIKFMKDNSKTHVFTDVLRKLYTSQGYYETEDDFEIPAIKEEEELPLWEKRSNKRSKTE